MDSSKRGKTYSSQPAQDCGKNPLQRTGRMKIALAFLMCHLAGLAEIHARPVSLGVEAGVPVTESFDTGFIYRGAFVPTTTRYVVGPAFEVRLGSHFAA